MLVSNLVNFFEQNKENKVKTVLRKQSRPCSKHITRSHTVYLKPLGVINNFTNLPKFQVQGLRNEKCELDNIDEIDDERKLEVLVS